MKTSLVCGLLVLAIVVSPTALASGNHPEAGNCPVDKPWFAICTHSLHSLDGWYSSHCHKTREAAQKDAEQHAARYHAGNMRWTGVQKTQ